MLAALADEGRTALALAAAAGAPGEAETVHLLLEHLAANGRARVVTGGGPAVATFARAARRAK